MKLLRFLVTGAVCSAVTTAAVSVNTVSEKVAKHLRGPDGYYENADLFPSLEHNFDNGEPDENDDGNVLLPEIDDDDARKPGSDPVIPTSNEESNDNELPSDNGSEGEVDSSEDQGDDLIEFVDRGNEGAGPDILYVRHLRSSYHAGPHRQVASPPIPTPTEIAILASLSPSPVQHD
ncbi:hypothetical protein PHMEG_00028246 [Phytophthora megakarya]|uniref:RxLR effector protein n=1 Tax=Phytophthora megakarya TaxID=4795 RepID=A0A225V6Z8_9STRA|nr:hypothetical protein PHMEG_00028246 [Phytophthora megakarya]